MTTSSIDRLEDQTGAIAGLRSVKLNRLIADGFTFGGIKRHGHGWSVMFWRGEAPALEVRHLALCRTIRGRRPKRSHAAA